VLISRARRAHDRDEVALTNIQIDLLQDISETSLRLVTFFEVSEFDHESIFVTTFRFVPRQSPVSLLVVIRASEAGARFCE
jgi:hypothetical protein